MDIPNHPLQAQVKGINIKDTLHYYLTQKQHKSFVHVSCFKTRNSNLCKDESKRNILAQLTNQD